MAKPIDATTRCCAVYGHPIRHSASPAMQNAGFAVLGLNWRYLAFEVHLNDLAKAIAGAKAMRFVGLNLTIPHKLLALHLCDVLDETARTWGAVNTIRFEARCAGGCWVPICEVPAEEIVEVRSHGFNTDADAIARSITEDLGMNVRGASVLLPGAGGAGRVAALKLAAEGVAELFLVNRTEEKAWQVAEEVSARHPEVRVHVAVHSENSTVSRRGCQGSGSIATFKGEPDRTVDLLLNATSLGLKTEDPLPVSSGWMRNRTPRFVYDMIYQPAETPLLREARALGCKCANGAGMLLYQGARALELWSGRAAPLREMSEALKKSIYV